MVDDRSALRVLRGKSVLREKLAGKRDRELG